IRIVDGMLDVRDQRDVEVPAQVLQELRRTDLAAAVEREREALGHEQQPWPAPPFPITTSRHGETQRQTPSRVTAPSAPLSRVGRLARTGRRMMPRFPSSPRFRTVGFAQYAAKATISDSTFLDRPHCSPYMGSAAVFPGGHLRQ